MRLARGTLFQKVKIPREFCFGPCQIAAEREGNTLLADAVCLPENRAGLLFDGLVETAQAGGPQRLDQSRFDPANRRRLSPPALRTFLAIADLWGLTEEQRRLVLGYPSRSTYHSWCRRARGRCW